MYTSAFLPQGRHCFPSATIFMVIFHFNLHTRSLNTGTLNLASLRQSQNDRGTYLPTQTHLVKCCPSHLYIKNIYFSKYTPVNTSAHSHSHAHYTTTQFRILFKVKCIKEPIST